MKSFLLATIAFCSFAAMAEISQKNSSIIQDLTHIRNVVSSKELPNSLKQKVARKTLKDIDQKVERLKLNSILQIQIDDSIETAKELVERQDYKTLGKKADEAIFVIKSTKSDRGN